MHPNGVLKHSNQHFIYCFNQAIGLWMIRIWVVVTQTQPSSELCHHVILEMRSMISNDGLRDTKSSYDMVEKKLSNSFIVNITCGHRLNPFSEIINEDDDICMPPRRARVTSHEFNTPLGKGSNDNNWVQGRGWSVLFVVINLVGMKLLDC